MRRSSTRISRARVEDSALTAAAETLNSAAAVLDSKQRTIDANAERLKGVYDSIAAKGDRLNAAGAIIQAGAERLRSAYDEYCAGLAARARST